MSYEKESSIVKNRDKKEIASKIERNGGIVFIVVLKLGYELLKGEHF